MRVATDFDGPHGSVATETVNTVLLLRWDLKHHQNVSLRQHQLRAWVVWPLLWTISMFMFITSVTSAQCCNVLYRIYSKTVIKEGLKWTTSWGWKVLCKDIWINLGIDTDSITLCDLLFGVTEGLRHGPCAVLHLRKLLFDWPKLTQKRKNLTN